jgi:hypothetical protein
MVWNNQQRPIGSAPLPEVHAYTQNKPKLIVDLLRSILREIPRKVKTNADSTRNPKLVFPTMVRTFPNIGMTNLCQKCGCYSHTTKKCRTPSHLVDLYLKSVGRERAALGQKYEGHFNI